MQIERRGGGPGKIQNKDVSQRHSNRRTFPTSVLERKREKVKVPTSQESKEAKKRPQEAEDTHHLNNLGAKKLRINTSNIFFFCFKLFLKETPKEQQLALLKVGFNEWKVGRETITLMIPPPTLVGTSLSWEFSLVPTDFN